MAGNKNKRGSRFPLGLLGLFGIALAGGPVAALILLGIEKIIDLTKDAGYEYWVAMLITYPLVLVGFVIAFFTLLLVLALPFIAVRFLSTLMAWSFSPPAVTKSEALTEITS